MAVALQLSGAFPILGGVAFGPPFSQPRSYAEQAEKLMRNLARRLERDAPGVSQTLLEGLDEILTVIRLGLPTELRALPGVYQHYREHDGDGAPCQSQREALTLGLDGLASDGCRHAGSQEKAFAD